MKRISYLFSLLFLTAFVAFTSCKPDETDPVPTAAQEAAEKFKGTYTVTAATRGSEAVDLEGQTVTLSFTANADGLGGTFTSANADVLPGDANLPASGTWAWPSATSFNSVIINPGNTTLSLTSALGASPATFTYSGTDTKGDFTATISATKQ